MNNSAPSWPAFLPRPTKGLPLVTLRRGYLTNNEESVAVIGVSVEGWHSPLVREAALVACLTSDGFAHNGHEVLMPHLEAQLATPQIVLALLLYLHRHQLKWRWAYYHERNWVQPAERTWGGSIRFVSQHVDSLHQSP